MRQLVKHLLRARLTSPLAPGTPVSRVQARLVEQGRCLRHGRDLGPQRLVQTEFEFILELLALLIHCSAKLLNYRTQCQDRLLLVVIDIIEGLGRSSIRAAPISLFFFQITIASD